MTTLFSLNVIMMNLAESGLELLQNGIDTWNKYYFQIIDIITKSPDDLYPDIWSAMSTINNYLCVVGVALTMVCFYISFTKNCIDFRDLKRPEKFCGLFVRLLLAMFLVNYSFKIGLIILNIFQGTILEVVKLFKISPTQVAAIPTEIQNLAANSTTMGGLGVYLLSLIGMIVIYSLSIMLLVIVTLRFIKIYLYAAISPIPLAFSSGETTSRTSRSFILNYVAVCFQGLIIAISFIIFSKFLSGAGFTFDANLSAAQNLMLYAGQIIIQLFVLLAIVKATDRIAKDMIGG